MKTRIYIIFLLFLLPTFLRAEQYPNALSFDGLNDNISLSNNNLLKPTSAITFEAWVYKASWNNTGIENIVSTYSSKGYYLALNKGKLELGLYRNNTLAILSTSVSTFTGLHHVAFTFDGQYLRLIIDGVQRTSNNAKSTYSIIYTASDVTRLGSNSSGDANFFSGNIDEVRFWVSARTASQISNAKNTEIDPATSGLVAYYRMNQAVAGGANVGLTTVNDLTLNQLNGMLSGFALAGTSSNWVTGYALRPFDLATNLSFPNDLGTQTTINWQRPVSGKGGNVVYVFMSATSSGNAAPVDGTDYTANTVYGSANSRIGTSGWYCVYKGTGTSVAVTGLSASTTYRVHVVEAQNANTIRYNTTSSILNPANKGITPSTQASNVLFSSLIGTGYKISWTNGNGLNRTVFVKETTTGNPIPANNTTYTANVAFMSGSQIGTTGWYCVYNGTGTTVTITGLTPGKTYRTMVVEYNSVPSNEKYLTSAVTSNPANQKADYQAPATQAINLVFSAITGSSLTANWTRGNGSSVAIFAKQTNTGSAVPTANITYIANANFNNGTQIGTTGWYCVYNGTGSSVNITGLSKSTTYRFMAVEYNGIVSLEKYITSTAKNNPSNVTTNQTVQSVQASNIVFSNIMPRTFTTSWIRGNGTSCAVFVKQTNAGSAAPVNGNTYSASTTFASGSQIGTSGWYCVYNGTGTTVNVSGLEPGLTYSVSVCEYSGAQLYYTAVAANNPNQVTMLDFTVWDGTAWNNGAPDAKIDAELNGNYIIATNIICKDLTVNAGTQLDILAGSRVTVMGNTINDGKIVVRTPLDNTSTGSLITNGTITNNDTMQAERYIAGGNTDATLNPWNFISSPVADFKVEKTFAFDYVSEFLESSNAWRGLVKGNMIATNKGYIVRTTQSPAKTMVFTGTFNTGAQHINLVNSTSTSTTGFNLIGNPYPSAMDWNAANGWTKTNVSNIIWVWNPETKSYSTWDGAVGINGGSRIILPMQSFMVQVTAGNATGSLDITDQVRTHSGNSYLKSAYTTPELIRLNISGNKLTDEAIIYKAEGTSEATKLFSLEESAPQLYVVNPSAQLAILKVNPDVQDTTIQLGVKCPIVGQYTISSNEISFGNELEVKLLDTKTNITTLVTKGFSYKFTQTSTDPEKRFVLMVSKKAQVASTLTKKTLDNVIVWKTNGSVAVNYNNLKSAQLTVFNMSGVTVYEENLNTNGTTYINNLKSGVYVIRIAGATGVVTKKISM